MNTNESDDRQILSGWAKRGNYYFLTILASILLAPVAIAAFRTEKNIAALMFDSGLNLYILLLTFWLAIFGMVIGALSREILKLQKKIKALEERVK